MKKVNKMNQRSQNNKVPKPAKAPTKFQGDGSRSVSKDSYLLTLSLLDTTSLLLSSNYSFLAFSVQFFRDKDSSLPSICS